MNFCSGVRWPQPGIYALWFLYFKLTLILICTESHVTTNFFFFLNKQIRKLLSNSVHNSYLGALRKERQ